MAKLHIGRSDTNDIVLDDTSVSRKHAQIEDLGGGAWRLTDVGSSAGTFVKDEGKWTQISSVDIDADTEVRFGEAEFHLSALVKADPATIRPDTESGLGQRAKKGAEEISRGMRQSGTSSGGGSGGVWAGMTKNTKLLLIGGGGVLVLLILVVVLVAVLEDDGTKTAVTPGTTGKPGSTGFPGMPGGPGSTGERPGSTGRGETGSLSGARATLARTLAAGCQRRGRPAAQCQCIAKGIAGRLTESEARQILGASRGTTLPAEIQKKIRVVAFAAGRACAGTR